MLGVFPARGRGPVPPGLIVGYKSGRHRKKYPDLVFDEEFDTWMNETNLDKYVAEFDFGPDHPPKEKWGDPPATVKSGDYFEFDGTELHHGDIALNPVAGPNR